MTNKTFVIFRNESKHCVPPSQSSVGSHRPSRHLRSAKSTRKAGTQQEEGDRGVCHGALASFSQSITKHYTPHYKQEAHGRSLNGTESYSD